MRWLAKERHEDVPHAPDFKSFTSAAGATDLKMLLQGPACGRGKSMERVSVDSVKT